MSEDSPDPTLQDDEAALAGYAADLIEAVESVLGEWIRWSIADHAPELARTDRAEQAVQAGSASIGAELRELLSRDIADQTEGPLQVLRRGVRWATSVLAEAAVEPPARDDFRRRSFPDDTYDLAPASFADVHPQLHEPSLVWGAAKAHVHLRRRREGA